MNEYFEITLLRRKKKKYLYFFVYDIVVVKSCKLNKRVIEKLGSYDLVFNTFNLNIFRLIYWISKNINISYRCMKLFLYFNIFNINL